MIKAEVVRRLWESDGRHGKIGNISSWSSMLSGFYERLKKGRKLVVPGDGFQGLHEDGVRK